MPSISRDQSMAECDQLLQAAVDARRDRDRVAEVEALEGCLAHPCAAHEFDTVELWSELAEAYRAQSRYDEAIEAWEGAIAAGYQGLPHPRANIAEILIEAGRRGEGDAVYQRLREECGDDVWLYNSAGWAYAHAADHDEAVSWLERGIELAMATGDSDNVLSQLAEMRDECLVSLGRPVDDGLAARVAAFERPPGLRRPYIPSLGEAEPSPVEACEHCGWDDAEEDATHMPITEVEALANALRRPAPVPTRPVTTEKVGRNQPCPCGSGRKYKHCHG